MFFRRLIALHLLMMTVACGSILSDVRPTVTEPACTLGPQPTGEKIVRPTIVSPPAARARPGETLRIRFSGGYVAVNNAKICGN